MFKDIFVISFCRIEPKPSPPGGSIKQKACPNISKCVHGFSSTDLASSVAQEVERAVCYTACQVSSGKMLTPR